MVGDSTEGCSAGPNFQNERTFPLRFEICDMEEKVGGALVVADMSVSSCRNANRAAWLRFTNPPINYASPLPSTVQVYPEGNISLDHVWDLADAVIVTGRSVTCDRNTTTMGFRNDTAATVTYYRHDPRMSLVQNTIAQPAEVDAEAQRAGRSGACPTVPRSFLNEAHCARRERGVCAASEYESQNITLDQATLRLWYELSHRHVHAIRGLRLEVGSATRFPPCTEGRTTRWVRTATSGGCSSVAATLNQRHESTASIVTAAIISIGSRGAEDTADCECIVPQSCLYANNYGVPWCLVEDNVACPDARTAHGGGFSSEAACSGRVSDAAAANPAIRDVVISDFAGNATCSMDEVTTIGAEVEVINSDASSTECWKHSHQDEGNVYDFSGWALWHPGNYQAKKDHRPNPITRFAKEGDAEIILPLLHPMDRWETIRDPSVTPSTTNLPLLGRLGDVVDFADLPASVKTVEMATHISAVITYPAIGFESCGSRGEVGNVPALGNRFHVIDDRAAEQGLDNLDLNDGADKSTGKGRAWMTVALTAPDQLRQRIAWALSQIFIVAVNGFDHAEQTELWANYYDIFVHNAFGNYRDIMREVSVSPVMGQYLTYKGNSAFGFNGGKFPDENYARVGGLHSPQQGRGGFSGATWSGCVGHAFLVVHLACKLLIVCFPRAL